MSGTHSHRITRSQNGHLTKVLKFALTNFSSLNIISGQKVQVNNYQKQNSIMINPIINIQVIRNSSLKNETLQIVSIMNQKYL